MTTLAIIFFVAAVLLFGLTLWLLLHGSKWQSRLAEPTVVAAVIAAAAAIAVAISGAVGAIVAGSISASYQKAAEIERTKTTLLLGIFGQYQPSMVPQRNMENEMDKIRILIESGILPERWKYMYGYIKARMSS